MVDNYKSWQLFGDFDIYESCVNTVDREASVAQSLYILLSTSPGERILEPYYGCNLHNLVFNHLDLNTETKIKGDIANAIKTFEPRVELKSIFFNTEKNNDGFVNITLHYYIKDLNEMQVLNFQYY